MRWWVVKWQGEQVVTGWVVMGDENVDHLVKL